MSNSLVEIGRKEWSTLLDLYKPDGIEYNISYTTIYNYIRWFEQNPNIQHVKFYCLNGDFSDGTFVITVSCLIFSYLINHTNG